MRVWRAVAVIARQLRGRDGDVPRSRPARRARRRSRRRWRCPRLRASRHRRRISGSTSGFGYSRSGDTVKDMTLALPAGLLANASIDGGKCIASPTPIAACQVGSGSITATATVLLKLLPVTETLSAEFDLVAPPTPATSPACRCWPRTRRTLVAGYQPLGTPADVTVRPSDAGLNIAFAGLPNTYPLNVYGLGLGTVPISVSDISSTFDNLLFPSSCPSKPASLTVTTDSYSAPISSASSPLTVTGMRLGRLRAEVRPDGRQGREQQRGQAHRQHHAGPRPADDGHDGAGLPNQRAHAEPRGRGCAVHQPRLGRAARRSARRPRSRRSTRPHCRARRT